MRKTVTIFKPVHISRIDHGMTVFHNGEYRTVGKNDITWDSFMGWSLFGNTYKLGTEKVIRVIYNVPTRLGTRIG